MIANVSSAFSLIDGDDNSLPRPAVVYARVTATNAAGWNATSYVRLKWDDSPPEAGVVVFESVDVEYAPRFISAAYGNVTNATGWDRGNSTSYYSVYQAALDFSRPPRYQASRRSLKLVFTGFFDAEQDQYSAGPLTYFYAVGTSEFSDDVVSWTRHYLPPIVDNSANSVDWAYSLANDPNLVNRVQLTGLDLRSGTVLYATVTGELLPLCDHSDRRTAISPLHCNN